MFVLTMVGDGTTSFHGVLEKGVACAHKHIPEWHASPSGRFKTADIIMPHSSHLLHFPWRVQNRQHRFVDTLPSISTLRGIAPEMHDHVF